MSGPVNFVNDLIAEAVQKNASDIHLEPQKENFLVRFRIDGFLQEKEKIPKNLENSVISRVKIMAGLDIAEKRIGQDGRINFNLNGGQFDLRISTLPTILGEKVVIRILAPQKNILNLKELGLGEENQKIQELIQRPDGLILITGPTGSGKTTTLYSILKEIAAPHKNTITIEDPVEYTLSSLVQVQVNNKSGLTFAAGLRWILRQDPDIIMVGEIRDEETARLALNAALTGHLVLATLHTNSCREAFSRLEQMGAKPYLVAAALKGIVAQRLVRRLCSQCRQEIFVSENGKKIFKPSGCPECAQTGYRGRTGLFELVTISEKIKTAFLNNDRAGLDEIFHENETKTLYQAGLKKAAAGITSLEEIERVVSLN